MSEKFNFYTALSCNMKLFLWFIVAFFFGFTCVWLLTTPDPNDTVIFIEDEEAFHIACYEGMRKGIE